MPTAAKKSARKPAKKLAQKLAAKQAKPKKKKKAAPSDEHKLAALLEKRLHTLGVARARVTVVATKKGQGADLRFDHIPATQIDDLRKAIGW
jgi:hypothetical protein